MVMETAGATVKETEPCATAPAESVRLAEKLIVAGGAAVGTPVKVPVGVSDKPVPESPVATHANGGVPPVSVTVCEYVEPGAAEGRFCCGIAGTGLICRVYGVEPGTPFESVTLIVNDAVPTLVGVPVMAPLVESTCSPPGSAPLVTDQFLYGGVPPLAVRFAK